MSELFDEVVRKLNILQEHTRVFQVKLVKGDNNWELRLIATDDVSKEGTLEEIKKYIHSEGLGRLLDQKSLERLTGEAYARTTRRPLAEVIKEWEGYNE